MQRKKIFTRLLLLGLLLAVGLGSTFEAVAQETGSKKEARLIEAGNNYDMSIGRAGIYLSETLMTGTAVLTRFDAPKAHKVQCGPEVPPDECGSRLIMWQQQMLEFHVYQGEEGAKKYDYVRGLGYVYFNLDLQTRRLWESNDDGRMSIYWWDVFNNKWVKCPTFLRRDASAPHGRLVCYMEEFGTYGLGIRQENILIKLIKLGIITVTPTP